MARTQSVAVQNNFSQGLITEGTALNFPANAATDTDNCVFQYTGSCKRRQEIDLEDGYSIGSALSYTGEDAFSEYVWDQVSDTGSYSFLVQQQGNLLHFFDISANTIPSANKNANTISLSSHLAAASTLVPGSWPVQFAQGNGVLIVTSRAIEPFFVQYDTEANTFSVTEITLQIRDFAGLQGDYADLVRPSFSSITNMKNDPQGIIHFYNLLNQGWWQGGISTGSPDANSAMGQWDTARTDMPSNCDQVQFFRASTTDPFDPNLVVNFDQGNTLATKGHFILDLGNINRVTVAAAAGYVVAVSGTFAQLITAGTGTIFGDMTATSVKTATNTTQTANRTMAFDGVYNSSTSMAAELEGTYVVAVDLTHPSDIINLNGGTAYVGKDLGSGNAKKIHQGIWYGVKPAANYAATYAQAYGRADFSSGTQTCRIRLYASNSAPANATNGTLLGTNTYTPGPSTTKVTVASGDRVTSFRYVWMVADFASYAWHSGIKVGANTARTLNATNYITCAEVELFESVTGSGTADYFEPDVTSERPQTVAYYAGRAFYGGINHEGSSNTIYFSQIIERPDQYGRCYQQNDPTSELFFDLLDSDGGSVKIPEMGALKKLFVYQTTLIALASNGVWTIRGSNGAGFLATNYVVRKISSLGTQSPFSVVDIEGVPYWWGEAGILRVNYNPQFDSFDIESITDKNIRTFFLNIPATLRALAKGAYDPYEKRAYWIYQNNTEEGNLAGGFNKVLCYDSRTQGFFPWSTLAMFDINNLSTSPAIQGIVFVEDSIGVATPALKLTTTLPINGTTQYLTYSDIDHASPMYYDWYKYSNEVIGNTTQQVDFLSYFVSGYEIDGQLLKFSQPNYVMLMLEQNYDSDGNRIESSAYLQGVFDFAISGDTGKWTTIAQSSQQIFNNSLVDRSVNWRRLKIRGKGRSVQFRVTSETGKPFAIVGWSTWKTQNAEV